MVTPLKKNQGVFPGLLSKVDINAHIKLGDTDLQLIEKTQKAQNLSYY